MNALMGREVHEAVLALDKWFETMRVDWPVHGYGGPVVHWWNHCLEYQGAGLDWRYEGIIAGYLSLWKVDGTQIWLDRAVRAGHDLVDGQTVGGHFRNSRFEQNPGIGGTPHEAAADVGLLLLALALRQVDPGLSTLFTNPARLNLEQYAFGTLWHRSTRTLRDSPRGMTFVPNKAATFIDAVILLSQIDNRPDLIEAFALPTGEHILAMQQRSQGGPLDGAIAQNRFGNQVVEAYFPVYIARCIPPLLTLSSVTGDLRFLESAVAAAAFLRRIQNEDGGFPQVIYGRKRRNRNPRWVAGTGDILRAIVSAGTQDGAQSVVRLVQWLLSGRRAPGYIAVSEGLERVVPLHRRQHRALNELGVVGWCDKAFRALTLVYERSKHGALPEGLIHD